MKIISIPVAFCFALLLVFTAAVAAYAQGTAPTTTDRAEVREEGRAELREQLEERREAIAERVEEARNAISAQAQKRIINLAANISNRIDASVTRLENIATRLNRRIGKLENEGVDTTAAKAELEAAHATLATIKADMSTIDALVYGSVTSESPREDWQNVKAQYRKTRTDLLTAQNQLRASVAALKAAVAGEVDSNGQSAAVSNAEATTSPETLTE